MEPARKSIPFVVPSQQKQSSSSPSGVEDSEQKFKLKEAFDNLYVPGRDTGDEYHELNLERAIRAVAFLLHWCSDNGNEDVNGFIAHGLGGTLELIASRTVAIFQRKNHA